MEWLVVVGLGALVYYLAKKSPGVQPTTSLDPDMSVPSTGIGFDNPPSPAKANGSPYRSSSNQIRLQTSFMNAPTDQKVLAYQTPRRYWSGREDVVVAGNYMTDAQNTLMTQDVPPIVQTAPTGTGGQKI